MQLYAGSNISVIFYIQMLTFVN